MIRATLLAFPVLLLVALDAAVSLAAGQSPNPAVAAALGWGPEGFLLAMGAWALVLLLFLWALPGLLAQFLYGAAGLLHFWGALASLQAPAALKIAAWLGQRAPPRIAPFHLVLGMAAFVALVTLLCWRGAGLLAPAKGAKSGKSDDKKDKKKDD